MRPPYSTIKIATSYIMQVGIIRVKFARCITTAIFAAGSIYPHAKFLIATLPTLNTSLKMEASTCQNKPLGEIFKSMFSSK